MYYNTNPIARYSGLQYAGSSLYNNRVSSGRIGKRKGKRSILKGRGILSSLSKTIGSKALSAIKSGAKQLVKRGKSAASSHLANIKSQAISSGKSLLDKGKSAAVSKLNSLKSTVANKLKDKLATAPAAIASHATRKLEKLINRGSSSSSSSIPLSKRRGSAANQLQSRVGRRPSRRSRRRRRRRARAARLGLARAIGLNSSIGML